MLSLSKYLKSSVLLLLFDDNKIKMAKMPGKKQKENPWTSVDTLLECRGDRFILRTEVFIETRIRYLLGKYFF